MTAFRFVLLILFTAILLPLNVQARRPHGTDMAGVIIRVDHARHSITLTQDDGTPREFVYVARTQVWQDGVEASPEMLKPGMRVQIDLHHPLVGPDFVTHVRLLESAAASKPAGRTGSR